MSKEREKKNPPRVKDDLSKTKPKRGKREKERDESGGAKIREMLSPISYGLYLQGWGTATKIGLITKKGNPCPAPTAMASRQRSAQKQKQVVRQPQTLRPDEKSAAPGREVNGFVDQRTKGPHKTGQEKKRLA